MKIRIFYSYIVLILFSCSKENATHDQGIQQPLVFSSNTPSSKINSTISLVYEKDKVIVTRTEDKMIAGAPHNRLYLAAPVSVTDDLLVRPGANKDKLWFVPFFVGAAPREITQRQCIKYICACGGFPGQHQSGCCSTQDQMTYIECVQSSCDVMCASSCLGYAVYVDCSTQNAIEWYSGGVIIEANRIEIIDPAWVKLNPDPPIILTVPAGEEVNISLKNADRDSH